MTASTGNILSEIWHWAETMPEHRAAVFQHLEGPIEEVSYGSLLAQVREKMAELPELPHGARIGLIASQGLVFLVHALAILEAGYCLVPVNGNLPDREVEEIKERAALHMVWRGCLEPEKLPSPGAVDGQDDSAYLEMDPAYLRFTSGSTGRRKGVLLGHQTIVERTAIANAGLRVSPEDRVLFLLPMVDHFVVSILLYLRYGATILLVQREADALALGSGNQATVIYGGPGNYRKMLASHGEYPLSQVRLAVCTTQPLSSEVSRHFKARFGFALSPALGIIEAGLLTLDGQPMPGYHITLVPDRGTGEIQVNGPGLLDAYVSPWKTRSQIVGSNGFATGDFGRFDKNGLLRLSGRRQNKLILDGHSYFCEEIEERLNDHPGVAESLVFIQCGELCAGVVPSNGVVNSTVLQSWVAELGPRLEKIIWVRELPRTATGKLQRLSTGIPA